ncbi:MAG: trigger factor [Patescibacteria group bacterium]
MHSNVERLDGNQVEIEVDLDPAEVDAALGKAYQQVALKVKVAGFRKGKVPRPILEARYGKEILYDEALDLLVPEAYRRALAEHDLEPIDRPELDVIEPIGEGKNFVFKAKVQVLPEVGLGRYIGIKAARPAVEIGEREVEERLSALRGQYAELVLAGHDELAAGDFAVIDFDGYVDEHPFRGGSAKGYTLEAGGGGYLPGFAEAIVGMKRGETREVRTKLPDDYRVEDLGGREAVFQVTLREIKTRELPELSDEFAKSLGFDTMAALRAEILSSLTKAAEREAEKVFAERVLAQVVDGAAVKVPEILIQRRVDQHLQSLRQNLARRDLDLDRYLSDLGKTEDELKEEIRREAEAEIKTDLVVEAIRKAEKIEATEEELADRLKELAELTQAKDIGEFRRDLERSGRIDAVRSGLAREKTIRFLVERAEAAPEERRAKK